MSQKYVAELEKGLLIFPYLLVFYEITNYLANDMYLPALPSIAKDLNISANYAQMTLTAWFLGAASMQLIFGPISDRIGRRPVLLGGGLLFIIATLVCSFTSNINVLLVARFLQGCAVCTIGTAGYSSIHECFDQRKAIHILAIMGSITVLAPAFGPLAGSLVLQWFSWRWIFGILAIWAMTGWFFLWLWMPESNPIDQQHPLDWRLIYQNYVSILLNSRFVFNTLIFCFTFLGMIAWIAAGPFLVIDKFKSSTLIFGVFQAMIFGSLIIGSQTVKYLLDKIGVNKIINLGLTLSLIGSVIALVSATLFPQFIWGLVISLMIFTFGSSLAFSPSHRIAIEACAEPMGARMAIFSSLMSLFGFIGGLLVSITYSGTLLWIASLLCIVSLAAWLCRFLEQYIYTNSQQSI